MIETTYVRIERAAAVLETDEDTLLIAATEGRIRLYALVNRDCYAELTKVHSGDYLEVANQPWEMTVHEERFRMFQFVPIFPISAGHLLKFGRADLTGHPLSDEDEHGMIWVTWNGGPFEHEQPIVVLRSDLFLLREAAEALRREKMPAAGTVRTPDAQLPRGAETRKRDTLLCILAAMADQAGIDPSERGAAARVAEWTEHIGAPVSEDTVRNVLKSIPEATQRRTK
ncbi:hypothetical protein GPA27_21280 [Aromatoleum toluolicum]|uniref:Uncharacterized protein n=1 Tax=Aromatoleum toluolicum TaxID=90060 RepID=A0ABX1NL72_9RHOO|nr:hypothetical protein [Aromatoleum toluolicum]NMF99910.1 hypothetical protein [Aromatoleum toluolicum]